MPRTDASLPPTSVSALCRRILERGDLRAKLEPPPAHLLDPPYPAHTLLHGAGRYGLQCLENLDLLPPTGALIIAAPLKIRGGSGSPLRVLALVSG